MKSKAESMVTKNQGLEICVSYQVDTVLLSTHKLKSENVTHEVNHE